MIIAVISDGLKKQARLDKAISYLRKRQRKVTVAWIVDLTKKFMFRE